MILVYIFYVFYVYIIKISLKDCKLLILNKINMSYMKLCMSQALWMYNELNDLKLIINRIEREKGKYTILCNYSTISIKRNLINIYASKSNKTIWL